MADWGWLVPTRLAVPLLWVVLGAVATYASAKSESKAKWPGIVSSLLIVGWGLSEFLAILDEKYGDAP